MTRSHELQDALQVVATAYNDVLFYKKKYADKQEIIEKVILGEESFGMIPFLTRAELSATPWHDRLSVPDTSVDAFRVTSGTSGAPLLIPRTMTPDETMYDPLHVAVYRRNSITKMATMSSAFAQQYNYFNNSGVSSIGLDPGSVDANARLVSCWKSDMLAGFAYGISPLAARLPESVRSTIRAVQVFGERASDAVWDQLCDMFPHAEVFSEYASIEAQSSLGASCAALIEKKLQHIHFFSSYVYAEVIDPETGVSMDAVGAHGELVITVIRKTAFPLIRYRTGDRVTIQDLCTCGRKTYSIEGRVAADRVRIQGGEINMRALEDAIVKVASFLNEQMFEVRVSYVAHSRMSVPQLSIMVVPKDGVDKELFTEAFAHALAISPITTYADAEKKGTVAPLVVEFVSAISRKQGTIRVIS